MDGIVDIRHKRCSHTGCNKQPSYGEVGGKAELCAEHAVDGMVDIRNKRCSHTGCNKQPSYGEAGGKAELCAEHTMDGMVRVRSKRCSHTGCNKHPSYGKAEGKAVVCAEHAEEDIVNVRFTKNSGESAEGNKRARIHTEAHLAATSAEAERGPNPAEDGRSSESDDATVKTEVGILYKVDPQGKRRSTEDERATPAVFSLGSEPDASVKAEVLISPPSKRKAAGGQRERGGKHRRAIAP
eukprot:g16067.t1